MKGARRALQEAYSVFLTTPENLDFAPPKPGYTPLKSKPRRITRDGSGVITSTPDPQCHAVETFTGRTSTTHRCAVLTWDAKIIAAAENQIPVNSLWLRFAYDPYLDTNSMVRNQIRASLLPIIFGIWCYAPRSRQVNIDNSVRLIRFVDWMILDTASRMRSGVAMNIRSTDASGAPTVKRADSNDMARALGYQSARHANWERSWAPHVRDVYGILNAIDREGLRPISEILYRREDAVREAREGAG